jgi:hypothetical protein
VGRGDDAAAAGGGGVMTPGSADVGGLFGSATEVGGTTVSKCPGWAKRLVEGTVCG